MKYMKWFHHIKASLCTPCIQVLHRLHISANDITFFGWIVVVIWFALSIYFNNPHYMIVAIWVHLFADGVDGVMARSFHQDTIFWSLLDITFDHVGIVIFSLSMLMFDIVDPSIILLYTVFYTILIIVAFVRWELWIPYTFVFRPRIIIYALVTLHMYITIPNIVVYAMYFFTLVLIVQVIWWIYVLLQYVRSTIS